jgi:hypothetical protein
VGVLALTQPAEARIIYTPTHHVIDNGGSYQLDFNHDGATDLSFRNWATLACTTDGSCWPRQDLAASLATGNRAVHNIYGAMALKPGMLIGSKQVFRGKQEMMAIAGTGSTSQAWGSWVNVKNRYLGVRFKIKGQAHYGWARLNVQVQLPLTISATLTGYAYETVPNKAIIAGKTKGADVVTIDEPTSLGRLAQGSAGLASWRPGK